MIKKAPQLITLFAVLLFSISVYAQQKEMAAPVDRAAQLTEWMKTNLQLTEEQVPKIQNINRKYANKNEDLRLSTLNKKQKLQTLELNEQGRDAELKQVLTESQYKTYTTKKHEIQDKMKEGAKSRKSGYQ
jgi:hypothetical protein